MSEPCHDCGGCGTRKLHGVGEVACPWCRGIGVEPPPQPETPEQAERFALLIGEYRRRMALDPTPMSVSEWIELSTLVDREIDGRLDRFWAYILDPDRARDARRETL